MQDFNQHRNGRSLRKYCQDEGIDYKWLQEYKRTYPNESKPVQKREYTHEDMEALGEEIELLRVRARQVDQDIRCGAISHEQWVSAAYELMERKKEILEILVDVDRYKQDLRAEIEKEKKLRMAAEEKIAILAFMYSLYESCKMNDIDFGEYVEDILTRMMNGDDDYRSMIPCYYTPGKKQEKKVA